ncbi:TonB-dependent receptor [Xanthomonas theicola]|uniref:Oar protein n=1 Tax=Xanthomonas theicola TaxID=56464 RepID=A0A2S6ZCS9_9XANT|nr:TonB-dependent receptor [Xanthomonas theicola]PPT88442.1 Oar protein [Xanthomonas theicola]QNH23724.1 TonB-dependent receptor [Xanthomonas theicola]
MNRTLRKSALALALALAAGTGYAQSTTGSIVGSVPPGAGERSVLITNTSGFSREVKVDERGRYAQGNLPLGTYTVTLKRDGQVVETRENITLVVGAGTEVGFGGPAQTLDAVNVVAGNVARIDVASVDSRTVVTAEQLAVLPLGRSAEAIALLAPGVVANSGGYDNGALGGSLASFGGSAASENAYYLNGFNTTDPASSLGGLTLPYGAIDQQEIFTGGYGAQYGRSNGGVISQVGKRGSNAWHVGAAVIWQPDSLSARQRDLYFRKDSMYWDPGNAKYSAGNYMPLSETSADQTTYSAYVGGPLVQDRLFFFLALEQVDSSGTRVADARVTSGGISGAPWTRYDYKQTRAYAKIDWQIGDNHLLEFTGAQDKARTNGNLYGYDYVDREVGGYVGREAKNTFGPALLLGKYTGYFGDNVTLTALYGKESLPNKLTAIGYDAGNGPYLVGVANQNPAYTGGTPIANAQRVVSITDPDREYKKDNLRLNLNWRLGTHSLDVGIDNQKSEALNIGTYSSGPGYGWTYGYTTDPYGLKSGGRVSTSVAEDGSLGVPSPGLADPTYGSTGYYVTRDIATNLYSYDARQTAYYLEDHWQATDRLMLSLGVRNDSFTNDTPFGQAYIELKNQWAPRLGFSWDVNGDSSLKVYGNIGRYYLGLPLSPAGLFTPAVSTSTYYTYSGINADGTPILATQLAPPVSANSRFGRLADVRTAVAEDIKGENQDELILGFTKLLPNDWMLGVRGTHRRLNDGIDDTNLDNSNAGLVAAAQAAGVDIDWTRNASAALVNPGTTNTYRVIGTDGQIHALTVTRAQGGYPEFQRRYSALEFSLERPFDGRWYTRMSYVWSHSYGTTEGQLRSDLWRTGGALGSYQGQAATSTTQSWDHAALMEHFNGNQSNDRRHQLKAYGVYQLTEEWGTSANVSLISGAPRPCLGYYYGTNYDAGDRDPVGYANASITGGTYHFCYNPDTGTGEPSPPGSHGTLGWVAQLDLGLTYTPKFADGKLALRLDVFNVTNRQTAINIYPFSELNPGQVNPLWNQAVAYQAPRSARVTLGYDF